jgi:predicted DNA binding CopG/RHH family protein
MNKAMEFSLFGLLIAQVASAFLMQVIGAKVKRLMRKAIQYSDEPIGDLKLIPDFLPSPEELALKQQNTKITISLSSESVAYFKDTAKMHHMQYQKLIRQLLDEYVAYQKSANNQAKRTR